MHHRKAISENVNARECSGVENRPPPFALKECEPEQHHHRGHKLERALDELLSKPVRRIRHDCFAAYGRLRLFKKVATAKVGRVAVVDQVGGDHRVTGGTQDVDDRTVAGGRFP